ncbi:MAG: DEAD/DEAH box helicase, partial [Actinomycetota bacterium]|nr:DEAD/DEAH box helicase [Actinomycetota bacterium]
MARDRNGVQQAQVVGAHAWRWDTEREVWYHNEVQQAQVVGDAKAFVRQASALRAQIDHALDAPRAWRVTARHAYTQAVEAMVYEQLFSIPIARIRETTEGRLRLGLIEAAGYQTVGQVFAAGAHRLEAIPGVGAHTATQVIAAAYQLHAAMIKTTRLRFDANRRPDHHTALLGALSAYEIAGQAISPIRESVTGLASELDAVLADASRASSRLKMLFSGRMKRERARVALQQLIAGVSRAQGDGRIAALHAALATVTTGPPADKAALWQDYSLRAATYNGLLIEIAELEPDQAAVEGFMPSEIAAAVHRHPLDTSLLAVSLRGYQAFGAKFALQQNRVIVGDEMGLGKTIEALAAICHLHADHATHSFVVCPASVVVNWTNEIRNKTQLASHRLHGTEKEQAFRSWRRTGGVAVTTYGSLQSIKPPTDVRIALLVVDEAHYVKNPDAQRTRQTRRWIAGADRTLFLTGTPMENRVEEFKTLVGHLQPHVAERVRTIDGLLGADRFRSLVAPVYLRRNQIDVLEELPPRIETDAWIEFVTEDFAAYRSAVASGNFMSMRRAAYAPGTPEASAKIRRLVEIVDEAMSNGRKVVVFSFFRDVLATVTSVLADAVVGTITGSVNPVERQRLVDQFSEQTEPGVLVSQIEAGGVGLNLQAASVVILTEPQWKPTTEDQAIARCHRMGQARPVEVHRLLAQDSVDERMLEVLGRKAALFDEYVRKSELTEASAFA